MILKGLSSVTVPGASITVTFNSGRGGTYKVRGGEGRGGGKLIKLADRLTVALSCPV